MVKQLLVLNILEPGLLHVRVGTDAHMRICNCPRVRCGETCLEVGPPLHHGSSGVGWGVAVGEGAQPGLLQGGHLRDAVAADLLHLQRLRCLVLPAVHGLQRSTRMAPREKESKNYRKIEN